MKRTWQISAGTAAVIGRSKAVNAVLPTTAYIMLGEKCRNNCRFCTRARESKAQENKLSRITWPGCLQTEAVDGIASAYDNRQLERACFQVIGGMDEETEVAAAITALRSVSSVPVCVSSRIKSLFAAKALLAAGAERICIALDAATPLIYKQVKGDNWDETWHLLLECAKEFPGRITTHLIVGLGETEREMVDVLAECACRGITVGLFAFTPVRGTAMESSLAPALDHYRRIQITYHLLSKGYDKGCIRMEGGKIAGFDVPHITVVLADGKAFETSGCPGCNRPYYNERPSGFMYNYPRPLTKAEVARAIAESMVFREGPDYVAGC